MARGIGMVTSRAKVACCWLQTVNGLTAAELLCASSRTQAAESLHLHSSLIMEWMERFQGTTAPHFPSGARLPGQKSVDHVPLSAWSIAVLSRCPSSQ